MPIVANIQDANPAAPNEKKFPLGQGLDNRGERLMLEPACIRMPDAGLYLETICTYAIGNRLRTITDRARRPDPGVANGLGEGTAMTATNKNLPDTTARRATPPAVGLGSAAVFFVALELTIIAIALPDISESFPDSGRATLSWIFTAYNVGVAAFLLIGGWLAERHGRKRLFVLGLLIFVVGSLGAGLAPSVAVLIGARAVQAIGGALLIPTSLAVVLQAVPEDVHDMAIALWGAMAGLATAIGPTLGAVLVDGIGWRSVFLVNVPLVLGVAAAATFKIEESRDPDIAPRVDLVAVPAGAAAVGLLVFIIVAAGTIGWFSRLAIACSSAAAILLAVFTLRSVYHPTPVFDGDIVRTRSFAVGSIGTLLFVAGFTGWLVFAPTFLTEVWGYSVFRAGCAIAPGPLVMAVVAGPAGRAAGRFGHGPVITAGALAATAATLWWLGLVGPEPDYLTSMLPGMVILGAGVGAGIPMLTAVTMSEVSPHRYAMGAAGSTTVRQVAMAVGIAIVAAIVGSPEAGDGGRILHAIGRYRTSWMVLACLFLATALVAQALPRRSRQDRTTDKG